MVAVIQNKANFPFHQPGLFSDFWVASSQPSLLVTVVFQSWVESSYFGRLKQISGFPTWLSGKESCLCRRREFHPCVRKIPWRRKWQPTPVFLLGKPHGQRSLAGYSPRSHSESDMTEWVTHTHSVVYNILKIFQLLFYIWRPKEKITLLKVVWEDGVICKSRGESGPICRTIRSLGIFYLTQP